MNVKIINVLRFIAERGKEPSTYRGAVTILGLFGISLGDPTIQAISAAGIALAGLIAVLTPDKLNTTMVIKPGADVKTVIVDPATTASVATAAPSTQPTV